MANNVSQETILLGYLCCDFALQHITSFINSFYESIKKDIPKRKDRTDQLESINKKMDLSNIHDQELQQVYISKFKDSINKKNFTRDDMKDLFKHFRISDYEYNEIIYQVIFNMIKESVPEEDWYIFQKYGIEEFTPVNEFSLKIPNNDEEIGKISIDVEALTDELKIKLGPDYLQMQSFATLAISYMNKKEEIDPETCLRAEALMEALSEYIKMPDNEKHGGYQKHF
jgi:hypothetical protein